MRQKTYGTLAPIFKIPFPCQQTAPAPRTRRAMLQQCAAGFGGVVLSALMGKQAVAEVRNDPFAPQPSHFPARARSVIFLYMDGGPSQVDTFDPKPLLAREHGQRFKQIAVPELTDLSTETSRTHTLYGLGSKTRGTALFGRQCLIARRLVERGVRFVELTCPQLTGHDRWDQHSNLRQGHAENALAVDQPIGALLTDLKDRGMLANTLVVWTGEFGRTPFAQGTDGRDHNPFGFSLWMAGGGIRGGVITGATDEYGYKAIENKRPLHDLHATMLHLLGMDHKRLTFRFGGRDMRLTDVHGELITEVLA